MSSVKGGTAGAAPTRSPAEFAARAAESNQPFILGLVVPFFILGVTAILLRTWVRAKIVKVMGIDDWVMLGALASTCIGMGIFGWQSQHGLGKHSDTVAYDDMSKFRAGNLIYGTLGAVMGMSCVKISMCFLLMRFVNSKKYVAFLWGLIIFLICFTIACWCTLVFWCNPVQAYWDVKLRSRPGNSCYSIVHFTNISVMNTAFNMATDVILATLPVQIIWNLQVNRRQKLSLIGVLSLGYAAVGLGVVKAIMQINLPKDKDASWSQAVQTWGFVQLNVSIVAACMPALRPLFTFLGERVSSARTRGKTGVTSGQNARSGYFRQYDSSNGTKAKGSGLRSFADGDNTVQLGAYPKRDLEADGQGGKAYITSASRERDSDGKSWIDAGSDSSSEKEILHHSAQPASGGIMMTTAYSVQTDHRRN